MAVARLAELRPPHIGNGSPTTRLPSITHALQETQIRFLDQGHAQRRQGMLGGDSFWQRPLAHASLIISEAKRAGYLDKGYRAIGGVRKTLAESTTYGIQHEKARYGIQTKAHGWDHERRLYRMTDAILLQPKLKLSDKRLYTVSALWISTHDADQLDSEARGLEKAKWWHDGAGAVHALVQKDALQVELGCSEDTARLITGASAALMFYHDVPLIHQRILDAIEQPTSRKPYEEFPAADGTLMRRYMSPEEIIRNLESNDGPKVDLLALTDWQVIGMNFVQKGKVEGFITPRSPFGLDAEFEHSFSQQLQALANLPEGATYNNGAVVVQADQGEARTLVPSKLLTPLLRKDIALLGDVVRIADQLDMITPQQGIIRKAFVPMNRHVPFYRPGTMDQILTREPKKPTHQDSFLRRGGIESWDAIHQIQAREGQLRPALETIPYVRDYVHQAHQDNMDGYLEALPKLMSGDRNVVLEEVRRILSIEHHSVVEKIMRSSLPASEKREQIEERQRALQSEIERTMEHLEFQIAPYTDEERRDALAICNRLKTMANEMYAQRYNTRRNNSPRRPFTAYHSTNEGPVAGLTQIRTLRRHSDAPALM